MTVGSKSWREFIQSKTKNTASVLIATGLWPLVFTVMQFCLKLFKESGIIFSDENPIWMRCSETVQTEVLSLPRILIDDHSEESQLMGKIGFCQDNS